MLFGIPSYILKFIGTAYIVWVLITTVLPQSTTKYLDNSVRTKKFTQPSYPYDSVTPYESVKITNSDIYFIISHPDDEVMFFSPSILELNKPSYNNTIHLACLSTGDAVDPTFGSIRTTELAHSAEILGIQKTNLHISDKFKDGMDIEWDLEAVSAVLQGIIVDDAVLVTFDEKGVSGHLNHISLHYGVKYFAQTSKHAFKVYTLKSLNFWEKYSFTLLTNVELFVDLISKYIVSHILKFNINISFFNQPIENSSSIKIYSDLNMLSVSYAAMAYGHFSQMVWFRYGWLILSRYLTFNSLIQLQL